MTGGLYRRQQPVDVHLALLSVAPNTAHGLQIVGRVPIEVEEDEARSADNVEARAARFRAQQKDDCPPPINTVNLNPRKFQKGVPATHTRGCASY